MINRVIIMGRITRDLELRQTPSGVSTLSFTVAVDRNFQKQGEERQADFISCVAWRQQAEFISRYFGKGRMIALEGTLRTRTYDDKNGVKHYITEVLVDNVSFTGEAKQDRQTQASAPAQLPQQLYGPEYEYHRPEPETGLTKPEEKIDMESIEEYGVLSDDGVPF